MGAGARDLAQLSPWLREHVGGGETGGSEPGRFGVFDSLASFLQEAAAAQPLVLILDDLHAADEASLRLLQFVARELRGAALLVVGTYRDADLRRARRSCRSWLTWPERDSGWRCAGSARPRSAASWPGWPRRRTTTW